MLLDGYDFIHPRVIVNRFLIVSISFMMASIVPFVFLRGFVLVTDTFGIDLFIWQLQQIYPSSVAAVIVIGAPSFAILNRFNRANIWTASVTGLIGGVLVFLVLRFIWFSSAPISMLIYLSLIGLISALVFWLAYRAFDFTDNIWPICVTGLGGGALAWYLGNLTSNNYLGISGLIIFSFLGLITTLAFWLAYSIFKLLHNKVM